MGSILSWVTVKNLILRATQEKGIVTLLYRPGEASEEQHRGGEFPLVSVRDFG